ncbi:13477_t:CDS:1 [Acaulospora morrowiae]|uniref:13477_t:CDS:1 n=1 Tax=Acaulospora morrowiae TaxID=94023 RepID=A0A9N8ZMG8_9GLOM|nr:13477_t:CDS:1 [Acaulospora morrowiae]
MTPSRVGFSLITLKKPMQHSLLSKCCWKHLKRTLELPFSAPYFKSVRGRYQQDRPAHSGKTLFSVRKSGRMHHASNKNHTTISFGQGERDPAISMMLKAENILEEHHIINEISKAEFVNYLRTLSTKKPEKSLVEQDSFLVKNVNSGNVDQAWDYYTKKEEDGLLANLPLKFKIHLLYYLIKLSRLEEARKIISHLKTRKNDRWLENYLLIMECLATLNLNEAIKLFKDLMIGKEDLPRFKVLSSLILALLSKEDIRGMEELLFTVERYFDKPLPVEIYNTAMSGYVKGKCYERACWLLEKMGQKNVAPSRVTYNILLKICAGMGNGEEAINLFNEMSRTKKIAPNARTYSGLFETFGRARSTNLCNYYFNRMMSMGVKPNCYTYGILIAAYARSKRYKEASQWFRRMVKSNVPPTLVTYTSLLVAWTIQVRYDARIVDRIFEDIKRSGVNLDVVAYTAFIHAKAKTLNLVDAIRIYQEMLKNNIKPNVYTYTVLISASAKLGDLNTCLRLFEDMKNAGIQPNAYTYCSIMDAYAKNRMLPKAFEIHDEMLARGIQPDTTCINCLMDACNRERQIDRVFELYNRLLTDPNLKPDEYSITIFLDSCTFNDRAADGKIFFANLVKNYKEISERNFYAYINLLGINNYNNEILDVIKLMKERRVTPTRMTLMCALHYIRKINRSENEIYEIKQLLVNWVDKCVFPRNIDMLNFERSHRF